MNTTLYLTPEEQKVFSGLPTPLQEDWKVETEDQDAYEAPEVLAMRMEMADFHEYPALEKMIKDANDQKDFPVSLEDLNENILHEYAFLIGAKGCRALIGRMLQDAKTDEDVEGLAGLTMLRHELLAMNLEHSSHLA